MRHHLGVVAVAATFLCAPAPAHAAGWPFTVTGGSVAVAVVCGTPHGVHVATPGRALSLHARRGTRVTVDRCAGTTWQRAGRAVRRLAFAPGDYRLTAVRRARVTLHRYVRIAEPAVDVPVRFRVRNVNRSVLPCSSDGATYELRGDLVAPAAQLAGGRLAAVTLYLHEFAFGSWFWHFTDVPGYDTVSAMAARGHASVVIDRLGYAPSPRPDGNATCLGAQADMAHQVLEQLRNGTYVAEGRAPVPAAVTALGGHSVGGAIAELEAASFGDVKALAIFGWADQGFSEASTQASVRQGAVCESATGEPGNYAYFDDSPQQFQAFSFHDADPAVVAAATARRAPDPRGDSASQAQMIAVNNAHDGALAVPVLLVFGADDPVFQPSAADQQAQAYRSSPSVTLVRVPRAAHAVTLERTAPVARDALDAWLTREGL